MSWFDGKKTYIAATATFIIAVCNAVLVYLNDGVVDFQALIGAGIALGLLFLRQGVKKEGVKDA